MNIKTIHISFLDGLHGNFLRYIIYRFLLKDSGFQKLLPFTEIGTSHVRIQAKEHRGKVPSYTLLSYGKKSIPTKSGDLVVQIDWSQKHQYIQVYNHVYRAGHGIPYELRKTQCNWHPGDLPSQVRNKLYSQIRESSYFINNHKFLTLECSDVLIHKFDFDNFFNFDGFVLELTTIAKLSGISEDINVQELKDIWDLFIIKSGGFESQQNIERIFMKITNNINLNLEHLLIVEEAFLNTLITKQFDIHDQLSVFTQDTYPTTTDIIIKEIKQVLKSRNSEFDVNKPISDQWEQVKHLP